MIYDRTDSLDNTFPLEEQPPGIVNESKETPTISIVPIGREVQWQCIGEFSPTFHAD
ncbi:MAG: hypothetical protein LBJ13_00165 [Puniceicoccales bacterium]|nr:hypothetical protein [Puniceicoccales bacterium]